MALYTAGTAFLQVKPSMKTFHTEVRAELARQNYAATVKIKPEWDEAAFRRVPRIPDQTVNVKVNTDASALAKTATAVGQLARNLASVALPVGIGAAVPIIAGLGVAAAQSATSLLLLPAAATVAAAAGATLAVGFRNVNAALGPTGTPAQLKKVNDALAALSPNALATAKTIRGLFGTWSDMGRVVQDRMFVGVAGDIAQLSNTYLPVLRTSLSGVAAEFNLGGRAVIDFVLQSRTIADVATIFAATRQTVAELSPSLAQVVAILLDMSVVGSAFLPALASGFTSAAARASEFIGTARQTGQLAGWISSGLSMVGLLGQTFYATGQIVVNTLRAANVGGEGFVTMLRDAARAGAEWTASLTGQQVIGELFTGLRATAAAALPVVQLVVATVVDLVTRLGPALPAVSAGLVAVVNAAQPVLQVFSGLVIAVLPALGAALQFLAPVLGPLVATLLAAQAATRLWTVALAIATGAQAAYGLAMGAVSVATTTYNVVMALVRGNLNLWVSAQWLLNAALAANPVGVVVVALGLLVAAVVLAYNNSETFRAIVSAAWAGIQAAAAAAWAFLRDVVFAGLMTAVGAVGGFFTQLWTGYVVPAWVGIQAAAAAGWAALGAIFSAISSATQTVGGWFTWLWQTIVVPAFDGILTAGKIILLVVVTAVFTPIYVFVSQVLGPIFTWLWQNVVVPAWTGIRDTVSTAWAFLRDQVWTPLVAFLSGMLSAAWTGFRDLAVAAWTAIRDGVSTAWAFLRDSIWTPLVAFLSAVLSTAWNAFRDLAVAAWVFIRDNVSAAWTFVRDSVFSPIVAFLGSVLGPAWNAFRDLSIAAWNLVRDTVNTGWVFIRDSVWNPLVTFIGTTIPDAFSRGVTLVGQLWDGIRKALRDPVQAAIDLVYNNGIVKVWNWVAEKISGPTLAPYTLPPYAAGGPVARPTVALVGEAGPEYVMSAPAVRNLGGMGAVDALHRTARMGGRSALNALNSGQVVDGADHTGPGVSAVGFGGVQPNVARAGNYLKSRFGIGVVGGVGSRPNASDHPGGLALDFMTPNGAPLWNFLASPANWSHFGIKYQIHKRQIMTAPGRVQGMPDRGSPTANHEDHVHVSFTGTPGAGAMDGGGAGASAGPSLLDLLGGQLGALTSGLSTLRDKFGGTPWGKMVVDLVGSMGSRVTTFVTDKIKSMVATAVAAVTGIGSTTGAGPAPGAGVARWSPVVLQALSMLGQPASLLNIVLRRMNQESGGNPNIVNNWDINAQRGTPSIGLMQVIGPTFSAYRDPRAPNNVRDPLANVLASMRYAMARYGSLPAAYNRAGGYDSGGIATGRGMMLKNVISPERVLSPRQTAAFDELVGNIAGRSYSSRVLRGGGEVDTPVGSGGAGGSGPFIGSLVVPVPEGSSVEDTIDTVLTRARHEVKSRRYSRGGG